MTSLTPEALGRSLFVYGVVRALAALPQLIVGLFAGGHFWPGNAVWVGVLLSANAVVAVTVVFASIHMIKIREPTLRPALWIFILALFDGAVFATLWAMATPTALRLVSMFLIFFIVDLFAGWTTRTVRSARI